MSPSHLIHFGSRSFGGQRHRGLRHFISGLAQHLLAQRSGRLQRRPSDALFDGRAVLLDAIAQRRELRQKLAERRKALAPAARIAAAQGLRRSLEHLPEYLTDARVAGYWATHGELPLNLVIPPLASRGQQFLLPVIGTGKKLRFAPWAAGDDIEPNRYGIPEPVSPAEYVEPFQVDLVLVPLLGFDRRGNRLGYGGGYYDRSFAFLNDQLRPTEPLLVGVAYAFQELPEVDEADWDVPLDFIATEHELIDCSRNPPSDQETRA